MKRIFLPLLVISHAICAMEYQKPELTQKQESRVENASLGTGRGVWELVMQIAHKAEHNVNNVQSAVQSLLIDSTFHASEILNFQEITPGTHSFAELLSSLINHVRQLPIDQREAYLQKCAFIFQGCSNAEELIGMALNQMLEEYYAPLQQRITTAKFPQLDHHIELFIEQERLRGNKVSFNYNDPAQGKSAMKIEPIHPHIITGSPKARLIEQNKTNLEFIKSILGNIRTKKGINTVNAHIAAMKDVATFPFIVQELYNALPKNPEIFAMFQDTIHPLCLEEIQRFMIPLCYMGTEYCQSPFYQYCINNLYSLFSSLNDDATVLQLVLKMYISAELRLLKALHANELMLQKLIKDVSVISDLLIFYFTRAEKKMTAQALDNLKKNFCETTMSFAKEVLVLLRNTPAPQNRRHIVLQSKERALAIEHLIR